MADFFCKPGNRESETLAVFPLHLELHTLPGKSNTFTKNKKEKAINIFELVCFGNWLVELVFLITMEAAESR